MSYKNLIVSLAVAAAVAFPVAAFADAPAVGNADSSAAVSAPATGSADTSASVAPATSGSSSSAGNVPATGSSDSSAASVPPTGNAGSSAGSNSSSNGGSPVISGGSSGSVSSGGSSIGGSPVVIGITASTSTCPLISSYMKVGNANNSADVAKLQGFLKTNQGLDVSVTGIFDTKTEAAVEAFQKKYLSDILGPWGATKATGAVYITTLKKINQLACAQPMTLSAAELSIINAYKANVSNSSEVSAPVNSPVTAPTGPVGPTLQGSNDTVGASADQNANTASAGNASILGKFWNFLKNLF